MKKLPKSLLAMILMLVFAVVLLPEIKNDFGFVKSYAAENTVKYTTATTEFDTMVYPTPVPTTHESTDTVVTTTSLPTSGQCGDNLTWEFNESTGTLTIRGTGDMWDSQPWHNYKSSVKSVSLPDGLTSIGNSAFFGCDGLANIKFPKSLTRIGEQAFEYCHGLTEVIIGIGVTDIGYKAFTYCNGLTRVTISASVEKCDFSAFHGTPNLRFITVDKNNKSYSNDSCGVLYNKDMSVLIQYPAGSTETEYRISEKTEQICIYAFSRADNLTDVYYEGSQTQWKQIYHPQPDELRNATIHFGKAEPEEETTTAKPAESQPISTTLNYTTSTTTHPHSCSSYPTTMPATTKPSTNQDIISEIYVEDMVLIADIEGSTYSGYYEDEINGSCYYEYFHYNISPQKITVVFNDGTTFTGNRTEIFFRTGHWLQINDNQSYENQWGVGNYYVSASLNKTGTTFKVEIIETPVESVKLDFGKPYFTENVDGYLLYKFDENGEVSDSIFFYNIFEYTAEITFKKGFEHYKDEYYDSGISYDQSFDNPWGVGKHTVTFFCLGYEEDIEIEIVANTNKIKSISVEKAGKLYRELDSYLTSDSLCDDSDNYCILTPEYECYDVEKSNPVITVEYEDGTVISEDLETMRDMFSRKNPLFYYYFTVTVNSTQSYENQWGIGKHTAYLIFFDKIVPFEVEVAENPVSNIEFVKAPDKTVYMNGEYSDIRGAVIRINYKDGEYKDVPLNRDRNFWETYYYDEKLDRVETLFTSQYFTENSRIETVFDDEIRCFYPVTVKENLIEGISIRNSENNDLVITAYKSDGTTEDMKMLYYWGDDGGDCETEMHRGGWILTDKGIFNAYFYYYFSGYHTVQLHFWDGTETKIIESNKLADCPWLDLWYKLPLYLYDEFTFSGEITKDNVDTIALLSIIYDDDYVKHPRYPYDDDSWKLKSEYNADYIAGLIDKNFVTDNIDLSVSERYNPADNTISINTALISEALQMQYTVPIVFKDGYWYVEMRGKTNQNSLEYDKFCYLIYDDDLKIVAFSTEEMPVIEKPNVTIKQPTETVISYGDSIILHADISNLPAGGYVEWTASNTNFEMEISADGTTCKITPKTSGETTFTATVYDAKGKAISSDEQTMTSKANFFDRLIAFFKKLFSLTKVIPQVFKGI